MSLFGCDNIVARSCDDCPIKEPNKIIHLAMVKKSVTIDKSSPATIIAGILAAEAACNAYVVRDISGAYDGGAITEGKGPGKTSSRIVGGVHTLTFTEFNYVANAGYWNTVKYAARGYNLYYFTYNYVWEVKDTGLSVKPKPGVTDDDKTFIEAEIAISWNGADNPLPFPANVDDLEGCVALFETTSKHFTAGSSDASIITVGSDTVPDTVAASTSQAIHIIYNAGVPFTSYVDSSGNLPAGLTLSKSANTIRINGTATTPGTYDVVIKVANDCGVSADFEVIFEIS